MYVQSQFVKGLVRIVTAASTARASCACRLLQQASPENHPCTVSILRISHLLSYLCLYFSPCSPFPCAKSQADTLSPGHGPVLRGHGHGPGDATPRFTSQILYGPFVDSGAIFKTARAVAIDRSNAWAGKLGHCTAFPPCTCRSLRPSPRAVPCD